ncbi:MAG TPA: lycopene cyclase domain-containing protein [Microbacteriaceae bacterium]|nr:lycopene cyclase domain-containing protein [Microbacteriaceae bacterium]
MSWWYAASLGVSLLGLGLLDRRFRLAFPVAPARSALVIAASVAMFLVWDAWGVALGIFFRGPGPYQLGLLIAPEIPVEEVLFLSLLSYLTLLLAYAWQRRGRRA